MEDLWHYLLSDDVRIIDVRAPVEFLEGSIPSSTNLPILNDEERALVGTTYKQQGSDRAVELGHKLVQGEIKQQRIESWLKAIRENPAQTIITCFRGGMRSQLAQAWCAEQGASVPRLQGGYKKMRQFLLDKIAHFSETRKLLVITGKTGAGKTQLLKNLKWYPTVDLEALARHRGSAFGYLSPQPSQIDFENGLALALGKITDQNSPILVEDESRMIGRLVQPKEFFEKLRQSPVLYLDESLEVRIENTFQEYVVSRADDPALFSDLQNSLQKIRNKLGGSRHQEILGDLQHAEKIYRETKNLTPSRVWIEKLLSWYYDPMYEASFIQRKPEVLVRGDHIQIRDFLNASEDVG